MCRTDGIITTVAGTTQGGSGDGGPATSAQLNGPTGAAAMPDSAIVIADTGNNVVRRVATNGVITTVAGVGAVGFAGDGLPARQAALAAWTITDACDRTVVKVTEGTVIVRNRRNGRYLTVKAGQRPTILKSGKVLKG